MRAVDVSTDGSASWQAARVSPRGADHQWQAFTYEWNVTTPGCHEIHVRATDQRGRSRISGAAADIGSFEVQTDAIFANGFD